MIYTLSLDFLKNLEEDDNIFISDILFHFINRENPLKIAKDKKGIVIDDYHNIAAKNQNIKTWLDLMSFTPSPFEKIDVDLSSFNCNEAKYLKLCKETAGFNKMIVYSIQNLKVYKCKKNNVIYENCEINILDKETARHEVNSILNKGDIIINSQVAKNNSQINDSENN